MPNVIDFDAWRAEHAKETGEEDQPESPSIIVGGKSYELPPSLPATVALDVIRLNRAKGKDATVSSDSLIMIGASLFGEDTFRAILNDNRMDVEAMGQLIAQAFRAYDPDQGEGARPNRKARRAKPST